jgi:tetratricopeptide (TPR) repeat protein
MQEKPSAYTPSNTSEELLEKLFVQRHKLLEKSVKWTEQSILTEKKNHLLYIGPRGSGKTHFITMLVNRIKKQSKLRNKMTLIWLGEDDVITGFLDFTIMILQSMVKEYPKQYNSNCLKQLQNLDVDAKANHILTSISQQLGGKTLVIIKENLNDVFKGLGVNGQHSLRSFLQEKNNTVMLCTSQLLFKAVSTRNAPFFGFFDTYHLEPLNLKQATELIIKIANFEGNKSLVEFLQTPLGKFRMRALHYLAGGNHRLYVKLVKFLTKESLDDLVKSLMDLSEELTPYFQERIKALSDQQGKIIQHLCKIQGAISVKDLAEQMIVIEQRTLAKQLGELKKISYIISHKRGKQSFYEIAEPLMRFSQEVKNSHGKPLKLIASLLRAWFTDEELQDNNPQDKLLNSYKTAAFNTSSKILAEINQQIMNEANMDYHEERYKESVEKYSQILCSPDKQSSILKSKALFNRGLGHGQQGQVNEEIADYTELINLEDAPVEQIFRALLYRGLTYEQQGQSDKAINDYTRIIKLEDAPVEQIAKALFNRGFTYGEQGQVDKAIADYTRIIKLEDAPVEQIAKALSNRGFTYRQQGQIDKSIADYTQVIKLKAAPVDQIFWALFNRGVSYRKQGQVDKSIADYTQLINMEDAPVEQIAKALLNRGVGYGLQGQVDKAIADYTRIIKLEDAPVEQIAKALFNRGVTYGQQGQADREIADYTQLINMEDVAIGQISEALFNRGLTYGQQGQLDKAIADYTQLIKLKAAPVDQIFWALFNRGVSYGEQGQVNKSIADYTQLINMEDAPVEQIAKALLNRGVGYGQQGQVDKAIADYTQLITLEDAPMESIAMALINRGVAMGKQSKFDLAIADYKKVINYPKIPEVLKNMSAFNIPKCYYLQLKKGKARKYLEKALKRGNKKQEHYPSNIEDTLVAIINLGSTHWQGEIIWLVKTFAQYKVLDSLGVGLIKSIATFNKDKALASSLEKWDKLWQKQASDFEEMQIPLQALNLSRLAIEQQSDKPLFALPKEIRDLVLTVLGDAIKKK